MERLALLSTQDDDTWLQGEPRPDLLNAYALPSDCLRPQYISDFSKFTIQSYAPEQRSLMTNKESPILVYTFRHTLVPLWSSELQQAIMYGLAASICTSLTGKTSRSKILMQSANDRILAARETAANTSDEKLDSLPDWIAARGYTDVAPRTAYFYPFGALLTSASVN
jgi:hypothetical protein